MIHDKIKIHGGRISSEPAKPAKNPEQQPILNQPLQAHSPGQTFRPQSTPAIDPSGAEPQADKLDLSAPSQPPSNHVSAQAKAEVESATGIDQLESTPNETTATHTRHHLPITKPRRTFGRFIIKTLWWLLVSILIVLVGALGAIYLYGI